MLSKLISLINVYVYVQLVVLCWFLDQRGRGGGGPGAVVKAACLEISRSLVKIQYCGGPPLPRGGLLGLRPPALEISILFLEGSVILFISPSSEGSPGPF